MNELRVGNVTANDIIECVYTFAWWGRVLMQYHTLQVYLIITVTILALHVASLQFNNRCILQIVRYVCFILFLYLSISVYIFIFNLCTHCMF